jgi:hypothetical protein
VIDVKTEERFKELSMAYNTEFVAAIKAYAGFVYTAVAGAGGKQGIVKRGTTSNLSARAQKALARKYGGKLASWQYPNIRRPSRPGKPPRDWGSPVSIRKAMWVDVVSNKDAKITVAVGPRKVSRRSPDIWNLLEFGGSKNVYFIRYLPNGQRDPDKDGYRRVRYEPRPFMKPGLEKGTKDFKRKLPGLFAKVERAFGLGPQS